MTTVKPSHNRLDVKNLELEKVLELSRIESSASNRASANENENITDRLKKLIKPKAAVNKIEGK